MNKRPDIDKVDTFFTYLAATSVTCLIPLLAFFYTGEKKIGMIVIAFFAATVVFVTVKILKCGKM